MFVTLKKKILSVAWSCVNETHRKCSIILMHRFICSQNMKEAEQNQLYQNLRTQCSVEHGTHRAELIFVSNYPNSYINFYLFYFVISIFIFTFTNFDLVDGKNILTPGEHAQARLTTFRPMIVSSGQRFTIREGKTTVLTGIVTKEHKNVVLPNNKLYEVVIV